MKENKIIDSDALNLITERITAVQKEIYKEIQTSVEMKGMLDNYDACRILGVSLRTLQYYREKDLVPFVMIHGKCLYKPKDIQVLIESNRVKYANKG